MLVLKIRSQKIKFLLISPKKFSKRSLHISKKFISFHSNSKSYLTRMPLVSSKEQLEGDTHRLHRQKELQFPAAKFRKMVSYEVTQIQTIFLMQGALTFFKLLYCKTQPYKHKFGFNTESGLSHILVKAKIWFWSLNKDGSPHIAKLESKA